MRITIVTSGRFHVANLACELIRLGHELTFHSIVPPKRLEAFGIGIPRANQRCHLAAVAPLIAMLRMRCLPRRVKQSADLWVRRILDDRYAKIKDPGDVFIGMSGLCLKSLEAAKSRGAEILLERGSRHILSQKRILDALTPCKPSLVSDQDVERELAGYELADRIIVGSSHVQQSFLEEQIAREKIFCNPYGVNLSEFHPTTLRPDPYDVIMVGHWSLRKGCDALATVVLERLGRSLLHVGPVLDAPLPDHPRFRHVDSVPQAELSEWYAQARVFAMPSQEEGLALVQAQALACGLPIVGSTRSGAEDLAELLGLRAPVIQAIAPGDEEALAKAIERALQISDNSGKRDLLGQKSKTLSWQAYGDRYGKFLSSLAG